MTTDLELLDAAAAEYPPGHDFTPDDLRDVVARVGFTPTPDDWQDVGFDLDEIPDDVIRWSE